MGLSCRGSVLCSACWMRPGKVVRLGPGICQLGKQNPANLKRLKFLVDVSIHMIYVTYQRGQIQVVTQLLKCHVPGVYPVKISMGPAQCGRIRRRSI